MISRLLVSKSLPRDATTEEPISADMSHPENLLQGLQLITVTCRDPLNEPPAARGKMDFSAPGVLRAAAFADQPQGDAAPDQGGRTVWTGLKTLRQFAHRGPIPPGKPADMQQEQILSGHDAGSARGAFAEAQKLRQLPAEIRQRDVLVLGKHGEWAAPFR
jgi:hypothetical protein